MSQSSGRLAQYKKTGGTAQSKKASIREEKTKDTKSKRNERFMRRRPLCEVSVVNEEMGKEKMKSRTTSTRRVIEQEDKLLKWREKREAEKAEEKRINSKKRPPFIVGKYKNDILLQVKTIKKNPKKGKKRQSIIQPSKTGTPSMASKKKKNIRTRSETLNMSSSSEVTPSSSKPQYDNTTETVQLSHNEVDNTAWVPGAELPTPKATIKFDQVFSDNFSPFMFTASNNSHKKDKSITELCLDGITTVDYMDTSINNNPVSRSDDSIEVINNSILHNHERSNAINDCNTEETVSELVKFRHLYDDVIQRFTDLCEIWEKKQAALDKQINQEACDQIRITVCQARLLMRSKLKQYIGLVDKAEDPTESIPTTAEDLQGFWDMMCLQISAIDSQFIHLNKMEENDWVDNVVVEKKESKIKRLRKKRASFGKKKTPSKKLIADREKRAEQSRLMKQKIMNAKRMKQQSSSNSVCSPPPAGSGLTTPPSLIKSKQTISPLPIDNMTSLTPRKNTPFKPLERRSVSALKNHYHSSSSESDGGSITKLVLLKPFKHLTNDVVMSPARRSLRIHRKSVGVRESSISDDLMNEVPDNIEYVMYKPNTLID